MNFTSLRLKKTILFFLVFFVCTTSRAQQETYTKYFNEDWRPVNKDSAFFVTNFTKVGNLFQVRSYWAKSNKINIISTYADTTFAKPRGKQIRYYETGAVQDSALYDNTGKKMEYFRFYPSGKLLVHGGFKEDSEKEYSEAYEESGKPIPGYILLREASFLSGDAGWIKYLTSHLKANTPVKNKAAKGIYTLVVSFVVAKDGQLVDISTENDPGFGMKEEAIRVISNSPRWKPAVLENKNVNAYRRQPITFQVE